MFDLNASNRISCFTSREAWQVQYKKIYNGEIIFKTAVIQ